MRILHTADLHLNTDAPETLEPFDTVLQTAEEEEVDLLTIGGDMFDSPEDASRLRTDVRDLCSGPPFDIVPIPGNHDADIFEQGFDLGTDLETLREQPYGEATIDDVSVIGVPFTRRESGADDPLRRPARTVHPERSRQRGARSDRSLRSSI